MEMTYGESARGIKIGQGRAVRVAGMSSATDAARCRILELRDEREQLERRLSEISSDVDAEVVRLLRAGMTGQNIAAVCGWSKQRVSQLRARAMVNAEPDLGPGGADEQLRRVEIASKGGRASAAARRTRMASRALLEAHGVSDGDRAEALRFVARATSDELRPRTRGEALSEWCVLRDERRGLVLV